VAVAAGFAARLWGTTRSTFCVVRPLEGAASVENPRENVVQSR